MMYKDQTQVDLISCYIINKLIELEFIFSQNLEIALIEINFRKTLNRKIFYLSLLLKNDNLKDEDTDEIVFEIACLKDCNKILVNGDLSFNSGIYFEKFPEININESEADLKEELQHYFTRVEGKLNQMINMLI